LPEVVVLDVGHGNCSVLLEEERVIIFDVPSRPAELLALLRQRSVTEIAAIIISHAHEDHIAGLSLLLLQEEWPIGALYLNADATRSANSWQALRKAVAKLEESGGALSEDDVTVGVTTSTTPFLPQGEAVVEILAPSPATAMGGVGSRSTAGVRLTPNSMSVVVALYMDGAPGVILAGDLDQVGLRAVRTAGLPKADILVFPHHGGRPGTDDPVAFTSAISGMVSPKYVFFSIGRAREGFPRPDVVATLRRELPNTQIACTQLSTDCAKRMPETLPPASSVMRAQLPINATCCAGSLSISLTGGGAQPSRIREHRDWVRVHVPEALCATDGA
jgi:beta-lactamase superfamily II metal-dependent hydrolase